MKLSHAIFLSLVFGALAAPYHVDAYLFARDLTLGSEGEDVRRLQIELNKTPSTQVAYTGVGSPGQETTHFGPKTQAAVVRYQNLYAAQVLTPLGLATGTGYVGASTRARLSGTQTAAPVVATQPVSTVQDDIPQTQTALEMSLEEFAGTDDPSEEDIREYARTMVYASQGYEYTPRTTSENQSRSTGDSSSSRGGGSESGTSSSSSGGSSSSSSGSSSGSSGGGGCGDLLFTLLGF